MNRYTKMFIVIGTSENVPNRINIIVYPNGNLKRQKLLKSFFWEVTAKPAYKVKINFTLV